jgi:hypothetical protein
VAFDWEAFSDLAGPMLRVSSSTQPQPPVVSPPPVGYTLSLDEHEIDAELEALDLAPGALDPPPIRCEAFFGDQCVAEKGHDGMHAAILGGEYTNWTDDYAKRYPEVGERFAQWVRDRESTDG